MRGKLIIMILAALFGFALSSFAATNASKEDAVEKKQIKYYKDTFRFGTPSQKKEAIEKLRKSRKKPKRAVELLSEQFEKERENSVKVDILDFFKYVYSYKETAVEVIKLALEDENREIKSTAFEMLAYYPDEQFEDYLISGLSNEDSIIVEGCVTALGSIESEKSVTNMIELWYSPDIEINDIIRARMIESFGKIGDESALPIIQNIARNSGAERYTRYNAIVALGSFPSKENYEILADLLEENNYEVSARVISVLPKFKDYADIKEQIKQSAMSDHNMIRENAVRALKDYKSDEIKELLLYRLQYDNSDKVKMAALQSLEGYTDDDVVAKLKEISKYSPDGDFKDEAKRILDELGLGEEGSTNESKV